jgi:hypothetical protein
VESGHDQNSRSEGEGSPAVQRSGRGEKLKREEGTTVGRDVVGTRGRTPYQQTPAGRWRWARGLVDDGLGG